MTSLRKRKRHGRQEREKGIDNDHDHHLVLYRLRLIDDDDNYELFRVMEREDDKALGDIGSEQWGRFMRSQGESTILLRLERLNRMLRSTPSEFRVRVVYNFVMQEYAKLQEEEMTFLRGRDNVSDEELVARMNGDSDNLA